MTKRAILIAFVLGASLRAEDPPPDAPTGWPREFYRDDGASLVVYQPQISSWKNFRMLEARAAVELKMPGDEQATLGSVELKCKSDVDEANRTAVLDDLRLTKSTFPELDGKERSAARELTKTLLPTGPVKTDLDRLIANMDREQVATRKTTVSIRAPEILVSHDEAILVVLASPAIAEPIEGAGLSAVVNTQANLFVELSTSAYFLLYEATWLTAPALEGPWAPVTKLPDAFNHLPAGNMWDEVREKIPGVPMKPDEVPDVFVTTKPTELVIVYGDPKLEAVPGTKLQYVANSESDLFFSADGNWYFLVSGRWFSSKDLDKGPWAFATNDLPSDFRRIPDDHTCGRVLASVPGTDQAKEAVIAAHVPRTAEISRKGATVDVDYEGDPEFKPIRGTKVQAADNTSYHVYKVGDLYYCCYEGVWFTSKDPNGPWAVCDKVPDEIYEIPQTSPYYGDTFVYVYGSDDDNVYTGYLPGYDCAYVYNGVVVYCTGYYHVWPRRYWRSWWRRRLRPRPTPYRRSPFRPTYGHGRHYDHMSGEFRRSADARRHQANKKPPAGNYAAWGKAARRTPVRRARPSPKVKQRPAKTTNNLHTTRNGDVYRKGADGSWQRRDANGKWQRANLNQNQARQQKQNLNRSTHARTHGSQRRNQYSGYRQSYGSRASSYRRSGGGRRGGGGGRGGGGRRR